MSVIKYFLATGAILAVIGGCSDHRLNRSDEEAMLVYRECMSGAPPQLNSADMSSTISNSAAVNKNTSIAANAQTRQEQSQQMLCMQQAGYEK